MAIVGPLAISASIQTADPEAEPTFFPIERTILAAVALFLGITGKTWAEIEGAGRKLAISAIVVAGSALVFAFGAFGALANDP